MPFISKEEFASHDCHAGPESGCQVCVAYQNQKEILDIAVVEAMMKLFESPTYA